MMANGKITKPKLLDLTLLAENPSKEGRFKDIDILVLPQTKSSRNISSSRHFSRAPELLKEEADVY